MEGRPGWVWGGEAWLGETERPGWWGRGGKSRSVEGRLTGPLLLQMSHTKPYIRKKAVLIMYKVFLKYPESLRPAFPRLKEKLEDPDPGWLIYDGTAGLQGSTSICKGLVEGVARKELRGTRSWALRPGIPPDGISLLPGSMRCQVCLLLSLLWPQTPLPFLQGTWSHLLVWDVDIRPLAARQ